MLKTPECEHKGSSEEMEDGESFRKTYDASTPERRAFLEGEEALREGEEEEEDKRTKE